MCDVYGGISRVLRDEQEDIIDIADPTQMLCDNSTTNRREMSKI